MPNWPTEWFDTIDSTNEEAIRRAKSGSFNDCWIAARQQTAGRGRLGRDWVSPTGNLYTTALFNFSGTVNDASKLPFAAALAVSDMVEQLAPAAKPLLKWPNDVRVDGAKISGILIETGHYDDKLWIAAGMGINIVSAPDDLNYPATSIAKLRGDGIVKAEATLSALKDTFSNRLNQLDGGFAGVRGAWLKRAERLGAQASVNVGNTQVIGTFEGMGTHGEMLLRLPDGELRSITAGDVELIKERADQ